MVFRSFIFSALAPLLDRNALDNQLIHNSQIYSLSLLFHLLILRVRIYLFFSLFHFPILSSCILSLIADTEHFHRRSR